ncbi:hypothetical protein Micbo1qcDRAFT_165714, partial [Microdochium bolleyi]
MDVHQRRFYTPPRLGPGCPRPGHSTYTHDHFNTCSQRATLFGGASLDSVAPAHSAYHDDMNTMPASFATPQSAYAPPSLASQHAYPEPATPSAPMTRSRKRKAESQENERLSKRLSLLNLEKNGERLYVPVESPHLRPTADEDDSHALPSIPEDDTMRLDDSAHKVYIYNLDDELSSSDTESTCSEDSNHRLVFLADIDKHLRQNRLPSSVFANPDGEIAGTNINDMQVVLYSDPSSLTVPEEQDSVRRAVMEARNRMRERQRDKLVNSDRSSIPNADDGSRKTMSTVADISSPPVSSSQTGWAALGANAPGPHLGSGMDAMEL